MRQQTVRNLFASLIRSWRQSLALVYWPVPLLSTLLITAVLYSQSGVLFPPKSGEDFEQRWNDCISIFRASHQLTTLHQLSAPSRRSGNTRSETTHECRPLSTIWTSEVNRSGKL